MDGTGARSGHADTNGDGPTRPADATGPLPLPVPPPADPTGPLPAAASWFTRADETAAQPVVGAPAPPPSWFGPGPVPASADTAAWPAVPPAAPDDLFDPAPQPRDPAAPPRGSDGSAARPPGDLFDLAPDARRGPSTTPGGTDEHAARPTEHPPGDLFDPAPGARRDPSAPPGGSDEHAARPTERPPGSLFDPPPHPDRSAPPGGVDERAVRPPEDLPDPAGAAPPRRSGRHAAPTGGIPVVPAAPIRPADATGPMPALAPPAGADAAPSPAAEETAAWSPPSPPSPPAENPPHTDAWSFGDRPAGPADEAWSFTGDDRRSGSTQTWPPPAPAGRSHRTPPSTGRGTGATDAAPTRRSPWLLLVAGVLVAVAAGVALVFALARADPADLVASAADEAARWPGVRYQGAVAALDGGEIAFDLTVSPDGAAGTLTRDGGRASAELLHDASGTLLRANREWWLYHQPARADDLAGTWVAEPLTETQEVAPVLQLAPAALAEHIRAEPAAPWEALEQQLVDGRAGVVVTDGTRRLVVGDDDPHAPLAVDVVPGTEARVVAVPAEEAAAAAGGAAAVRQESAPRTLTQFLLERPVVEIQLQPEPLCTAPTCRVSVTVTNSGTVPARGRLEVSADGQVVATHPLDVPPGQGATFEASAPNPQFSQPGSSGQILWESRAIDE